MWYIITTMKAGPIYQEKWVQGDRTVEIRVWAVPKAKDKPHGYKYSLVYIKDGARVVGYDNAEGRGDHRHYGEKEEPYQFTNLDALMQDFYDDLGRYWK